MLSLSRRVSPSAPSGLTEGFGGGGALSIISLKLDATQVPHPQVDEDSGVRLDGPWPVPMDGLEAWEAGGRVVLAWDLGGSSAPAAQLENSSQLRRPARGRQALRPSLKMPNGPWTIGLWVKWAEGDGPLSQATLLRFSGGLVFGLDSSGIGFGGPEVEAALEAARKERGLKFRPPRIQVPRDVWTAICLEYTDESAEVCEVHGAWDSRGFVRLGRLGPAPCRKELIELGGDGHVGYLAQISVWRKVLDKDEQAGWFASSSSRFGLIAPALDEDDNTDAHELKQILQKIAEGASRLRRDSIASIGSVGDGQGRRRPRLATRRSSLASTASPRTSPRVSPNSTNNLSKIRRISRLLNSQVQAPPLPPGIADPCALPPQGPTKPATVPKAAKRMSPQKVPPVAMAGLGANKRKIAKGKGNPKMGGTEECPFGGDKVVLTKDEHAALIQQAARLLAEADNEDGLLGTGPPTALGQQVYKDPAEIGMSAVAARRNVQPSAVRLPACQGSSNGAVPVFSSSALEALQHGDPGQKASMNAAGQLNRAALLSSLAHAYAAAAYEWYEENEDDQEDDTLNTTEVLGYSTLPALANSIRAWPFNKSFAIETTTPRRLASRALARAAAEDELAALKEPPPQKAWRAKEALRSTTVGTKKSISVRVREAELQLTRNHVEMKNLRHCLNDLTEGTHQTRSSRLTSQRLTV
mmetsp:Transcript_58905/g.137651  ORF Transcript_58905/g.137651 Transcript_58905/m.137651 type:complete len:698 (+) Transcript_58905:154-2247(+)